MLAVLICIVFSPYHHPIIIPSLIANRVKLATSWISRWNECFHINLGWWLLFHYSPRYASCMVI